MCTPNSHATPSMLGLGTGAGGLGRADAAAVIGLGHLSDGAGISRPDEPHGCGLEAGRNAGTTDEVEAFVGFAGSGAALLVGGEIAEQLCGGCGGEVRQVVGGGV